MIFNELLLIVCNVNLPIYLRLCHSHSDIFTAHHFFLHNPKQTVGFLIFSQYRPRSYMKNIGINYNDSNRKTVQYCAVAVLFFLLLFPLQVFGTINGPKQLGPIDYYLELTLSHIHVICVCVCIHAGYVSVFLL